MPLWGANNNPVANDEPTFAHTANSRWYGNCIGVRADQIDAGNNPRIANPGWIGIKAYTDSAGHQRYRLETLVAMASIVGDDPAADVFFPNTIS